MSSQSVEDLLGAVLGELAAAYTDDEAMQIVLEPGQTTTADWCWGGCGTAYVRVDSVFPSSVFPNPDTTPAACAAPSAVRLHIGVHRCIAGPDDAGNPPPAAEQAADALMILDDAGRLLRALRCATWFNPKETVIGSWTPMGPFGNCAGGYWTITYRTRNPWPAPPPA